MGAEPLHLSRALVVKAFHETPGKRLFSKTGRVLARYAQAEETIFTLVAGKLETLNKAQFGDVVVMNAEIGGSAERYILPRAKFESRYTLTPGAPVVHADGHAWVWADASGRVLAFEWTGDPIRFEAPWGEDMVLESGDWLCQALPGPDSDVYRIERGAFLTTYREVLKRAEPAHA